MGATTGIGIVAAVFGTAALSGIRYTSKNLNPSRSIVVDRQTHVQLCVSFVRLHLYKPVYTARARACVHMYLCVIGKY